MKKIKAISGVNSFHCPVESISGVWCFERRGGERTTARSTPGHLLHCHVKGSTELQANGREYLLEPDSVIYYHESEEVKNYFIDDIKFYSIAFHAPKLMPLPLSKRVFKVEQSIVELFREIYEVYTSNPPDAAMRLYALLLLLLPQLGLSEDRERKHYSNREKLWFEVEAWILKNRKFRVGIPAICRQFNISPATLLRSSQATVSVSVTKRLQQIRMNEARALLLYSGLNITETADYLGYPRMHEFSREFSNYFKHPPSSLNMKES